MKTHFRWIGLIVLAVFLFSCSLTSIGKPADQESTTAIPQPTHTSPRPTATSKPTLTATPKPTSTPEAVTPDFESVVMGGDFGYEAFVLTYDPEVWKVIQDDSDYMDYLILSRKKDPECIIYENIPRGLPPNLSLEQETIEERMGGHALSLAKWTLDGRFYYGIFNFEDLNISIAVEPWGTDPETCYEAAWMVIERSAESNFE